MHYPHRKLLALFGSIAVLALTTHAQTADFAAASTGAFQPRRISAADLKPRSEWRNVGRSTPAASFETLCWAQLTGDLDLVVSSILIEDAARAKAQAAFAALSLEDQRQLRDVDRFIAKLLALRNPLAGLRILAAEPNPDRSDEVALHWLNSYDDGRIRENKNVVLRNTADGWRQKITLRFLEPLLKLGINRTPGPVTGRALLPPTPPAGTSAPLAPDLVAVRDLQNRGNATAAAAFETLHWAKARRDLATLERLIAVPPAARAKAEARLASLSADGRGRMPEVTTPERLVLADWLAASHEAGIQVHTETALDPDRIYFSGVRHDERGRSNFDCVLRRTAGGWQWLMGDHVFTPTPLPASRSNSK